MSHHSDFINHLCNERYAIWDNFLAAEHYQSLVTLSAKLYQQQRYEKACVGRAQQRQHEQKIPKGFNLLDRSTKPVNQRQAFF